MTRVSLTPRRGCPFLLLGGVAFLLACGDGPTGPAGRSDPTPRRGGTAVLGSISDVDSWNEYLSHESFANTLNRRIFLRLATEAGEDRDQPPPHVPELAESWSAGNEGRSITFILRDTVWSDGAPIRASDVRFTWKAQTSAEVAWVNVTSKEHITDVIVTDDRTVTFHFDRHYPYQLADAVEGGILPEHVFGQVPLSDWRTHDWSEVKVGSGPFILENHRPGQEIVLTRNPRYFREGLPHLDRVVVRVVPDAGNLLTQLLSGSVDYMENVPPWEAERVAASEGMRLIPILVPRYDYIGWNGARPPFDDPAVRRAMTLAIDREALVEELLYGYGRVSVGPVLSYTWGADPDIEAWLHDPARARQLLAERGFTQGANGILQRDGRPLSITLTTNAGNRVREAALIKIQAQLLRVGVKANLRLLEMKTFRERNVSGEFDAYLGGWSLSGRVLKELFGSQHRPPRGVNVVAYSSPEADRILESLDAAREWAEMKPMLSAFQRRIHEDQPYTFLYEVRRLTGVGPRLQGVFGEVPADPLAHLENDWVTPR